MKKLVPDTQPALLPHCSASKKKEGERRREKGNDVSLEEKERLFFDVLMFM